MGVLQYHNTKQHLQEEYKNNFTQKSLSLDTELEALENYVERLNFLAKESYNTHYNQIFNRHLLEQAHAIMEIAKSGDYYLLPPEQTIMGHPISGTICGLDTIILNDSSTARLLHMSLSLLPSQQAMHNSNKSITLSYFISSKYNFSQILPEIPLKKIITNYPDFYSFQKDAFQVYDSVSPLSVNPEKKLFWTKPYIDRAGNGMMVTCGVPFYYKSDYLGVIGADIVLNFLNKYTADIEHIPGTISLVTQEGTILSQTGLSYTKDDTLSQASVSLLQSIETFNSTGKQAAPHVIVKKLERSPWYLVYTLDEKTLNSKANQEIELIIVSIILIILLLSLAYFYIYHHLIIPARISEEEIQRLNRNLDAKVHERTKELLEREENLKLTLNSIGDAVVVTNAKGKITRMNPVAERLLGVPLEDVMGQRLTHVFNIKDARSGKTIPSPIDTILQNDEIVELDGNTILTSADGREYHIADSGAPIKNRKGELVGAILVFRDISDEYLMQKNLNNLRNYLTNIIDSMPSLLIGINVNGKVTQWNHTAATLTNISSREAKGKKLQTLLPSMSSLSHTIEESIFSRKIHKESDTGLFTDIGLPHEEITIYPLSGNAIQQGAVIRIDDISEKITLENQLLQSRKMDAIGQLSGGIAHDFNNMLNGILVSAEMLQLDHQNADADTIGNIEVILQAALQASELSKKLLTFGRKQQIRKSPLDILALLDETHSILSRTIDKKVEISLTSSAQETTIFGDSSSLQNVFINLGINASHAMPNGGLLSFNLSNKNLTIESCRNREFSLRPGEYIAIEVVDTGVGIEKENLEKIFEPFFTTKEQGKGTGLGLSASYGTIKDHNGSITVDSIIDSGTTFTILLPCASSTHSLEATQEELREGSGTILLVDDESFIRRTTGKMLEKLGYNVITASNGMEAIEIYQKEMRRISCVLMDIIMPELDGRDAFLKLIAINPSCKVILSSGFTKNDSLTELFEKGLWRFLPKPYRSYELADMLQEL